MSMDRQCAEATPIPVDRVWIGGGLVLLLALAYNLTWLVKSPPGLDRDAAANGWMALNWLRYGIVPFWMPHASAPEPLIVWLQTITTAFLGPSVAALRSASALFLSLAALVVYFLTLEVVKLFPAAQRFWAAFLAGVIFACNPVVTQVARTGLRASTLPLLSGLFFLCLLRAWHSNARRDYVLSGLVLGVSAYTYLAARFLPIVVLIFVPLAWWLGWRNGHARRRAINLVLMVIAAFVVVLPQLVFFAIYPASFLERAQSVSLLANPDYGDMGLASLLAQKVLGILLMFGIEWGGQYNQAQWPLLLPLPFFGLILSLPVIFRERRQPAILLTVVALLVMLLPDLIGGDRLRPHELRVIGAYVPTVVLSGVGLAYGLGYGVRWMRGRAAWGVSGALLALLIAGWGIVDWFGLSVPALAQSNYAWFARPDVAIAEAINRHDQPLLVPLNDYSRSVIAYLSAQRITHLGSGIEANGQVVEPSTARVLLLWPDDPDRARVESTSYRFDPTSLVLIDQDRAYLMPPARSNVAQLQSECAAQLFDTASGQAAGALCEVAFADFDFPAQLSAPVWRVDELYDGGLRLRGVNAASRVISAGASLDITSLWQSEQPTRDRWRYFVHVLDDHQNVVAGDDLMPGYGVYETPLWQADELVPIQQAVQLPANLAPGRYWIEVGLYDPLSGARALTRANGADHTVVGPLKVPLQEGAELPNATPLTAQFGDEITLDGYQLARDNGELAVTLRLAALRPPERDYTVFVHVEDASGKLVAQNDAQPRAGQYPTTIWDAGETVVSAWPVTLPPSLAPGRYRVWMGMYDGQSGERLPVQAAGATVDADRLLLREVELP
jgi:4-amino-4-deoxy-L-arabinose transferase-like glycosyltransferase